MLVYSCPNANVDGPIATSSGTATRSSGACDNVSYPETETIEIDDEDELKPKYFVPTFFFLSWYAKDQLKEIGCSLVNRASKKKLVAVTSKEGSTVRYVGTVRYASIFSKKYGTPFLQWYGYAVADLENFGGGGGF